MPPLQFDFTKIQNQRTTPVGAAIGRPPEIDRFPVQCTAYLEEYTLLRYLYESYGKKKTCP